MKLRGKLSIPKEMSLQVMALGKASMTNQSISHLLQSPLGKRSLRSYQPHEEGCPAATLPCARICPAQHGMSAFHLASSRKRSRAHATMTLTQL